jgi:hypothetical protein
MSSNEAHDVDQRSPHTPLDRFRAVVLAEVALQARLQACHDRSDFVALAVEMARDLGLELSADAVEQALRSPPFGVDDPTGEFVRAEAPPPDWLPVRSFWRDGELYLHWAHFGERRLRDPFFEGDARRCLSRPFNQFFRYVTPITALADRSRKYPGLSPSGFIFHMSRCGSTLVMQMLATLDRNIAISEAGPIDTVVRARGARPDLSTDEHVRLLNSLVGALAAPRFEERDAFIKLDCWHTLALPLFRRAFPDVPWVFLYRDPVEVLVSQLAMPGTQMIPGMLGADLYGLGSDHDPRRPEDYYARVLAKVCEPVLRHASSGEALLINYEQLPEAMWTRILPHFGIAVSDSDRAAMMAATRHDAKAPHFEFAGDSQAKQRAATAAIRSAADRWLGGIYAQLETLRGVDARSA